MPLFLLLRSLSPATVDYAAKLWVQLNFVFSLSFMDRPVWEKNNSTLKCLFRDFRTAAIAVTSFRHWIILSVRAVVEARANIGFVSRRASDIVR